MTKAITLLLGAAMVLSLSSFGDIGDLSAEDSFIPNESVQIPNPFTDCDTLDEAEKLVGFELSAPDVIGQSTGRIFRASDFDLLEVIYKQGDTETARVRKAAGSGDISGDYNNYAYVGDISTNGMTVTVKGEKDNISLAIWQKDGYTYSVSVESPLSAAEMSTLVSSIR